MNNHELGAGSPESLIAVEPVSIEYELTDDLGRVVAPKIKSFDLSSNAKPGKVFFDGYFECSRGSFAFQGDVSKAVEIFKAIRRYLVCSAELEKLDMSLKAVHAREESAGETFRYHNDSSRLEAVWREAEEISEKIKPLKFEYRRLTDELAPCKI
ncbi:MAG: hypothetical protein V4467_04325 [Patescibacteria group bacterium]